MQIILFVEIGFGVKDLKIRCYKNYINKNKIEGI